MGGNNALVPLGRKTGGRPIQRDLTGAFLTGNNIGGKAVTVGDIIYLNLLEFP